jgi:hypothetical protein
MQCEDATNVWMHENGPIQGLQELFPDVWSFIVKQIEGFVHATPDDFNSKVQATVSGNYRITHRGDDGINQDIHDVLGDVAVIQVLKEWALATYGQEVVLGNVCCSGCISAEPDFFTDVENLKLIQKTAVQIEIDTIAS